MEKEENKTKKKKSRSRKKQETEAPKEISPQVAKNITSLLSLVVVENVLRDVTSGMIESLSNLKGKEIKDILSDIIYQRGIVRSMLIPLLGVDPFNQDDSKGTITERVKAMTAIQSKLLHNFTKAYSISADAMHIPPNIIKQMVKVMIHPKTDDLVRKELNAIGSIDEDELIEGIFSKDIKEAVERCTDINGREVEYALRKGEVVPKGDEGTPYKELSRACLFVELPILGAISKTYQDVDKECDIENKPETRQTKQLAYELVMDCYRFSPVDPTKPIEENKEACMQELAGKYSVIATINSENFMEEDAIEVPGKPKPEPTLEDVKSAAMRALDAILDETDKMVTSVILKKEDGTESNIGESMVNVSLGEDWKDKLRDLAKEGIEMRLKGFEQEEQENTDQ